MTDKSDKKPFLIAISVAPGSGKSTLAKQLIEFIQFIYIDVDAVLQNIWLNNTENKEYNREKVGVPMLYKLVKDLGSKDGLNLIIDTVPTDETTIKELAEIFQIKHIHCRAKDTLDRFYKREIGPNGEEPDWLGPHMTDLTVTLATISEPPALGVPVIEIETSNEYQSSLKQVVIQMGIPDGYKLWNKFLED